MTVKRIRNRWLESQSSISYKNEFIQLCINGGILIKEHSPFELLDNDYIDFRGLNLGKLQIKKLIVEKADFSYCSFQNSWIENSVFKNVTFLKVDFSECSDRGNIFNGVSFSYCSFAKAGLGYQGSIYCDCVFENSSFVKTSFIRAEYISCRFINCKFHGVDFNASSFEDCSFEGLIKDVWFRGGYGYSYGEREFGRAKKNQMRNISFKKAILEGVNFSNECDLTTIELPSTGNYQLYDNWTIRLERLKTIISEWSTSQRIEADIFVNSYLVHAKTQDWFLINIEEIQRDFGIDVASNIIIELNRTE